MSSYPYQKQFVRHCNIQQHLKPATIAMIEQVLTGFWRYYTANSVTEAALENITAEDVSDYLAQLEIRRNLKTTTINKYISYIKKYFTFLAEARFIPSYPLFALKGRTFNRRITIVVNWMDHLSELPLKKLNPNTVKILVLTGLGYPVEELLKIRWSQLAPKIDDDKLRSYLEKHLNFEKDSDPILFQTKNGAPIHGLQAALRPTLADQEKLTLKLIPTKLHQSYMISKVANLHATDEELMLSLHISRTTLAYYQHCVSYYNLVEFQEWVK